MSRGINRRTGRPNRLPLGVKLGGLNLATVILMIGVVLVVIATLRGQ